MEGTTIPTIDYFYNRYKDNSMLYLINTWWELKGNLNNPKLLLTAQTATWHRFLTLTKIIKKRGFWSVERQQPRYTRD